MKKIRQNLIDCHISYVYDICMEEMWQMNAEDTWGFHFDKVGRWWSNNTQIDIVALDKTDGNIVFGECKYWSGKVGVDILTVLEGKAKEVNWRNHERHNHYVLFSISGFTDELIALSKIRGDILLRQ
jgi:Archaea bacterial proteins of unknown function.